MPVQGLSTLRSIGLIAVIIFVFIVGIVLYLQYSGIESKQFTIVFGSEEGWRVGIKNIGTSELVTGDILVFIDGVAAVVRG